MDDAHRPFQVWRHVLGTPQADDTLVYEDLDELFYVSVYRTRDARLLMVDSSSTETTEVHFAELGGGGGGGGAAAPPALRVIAPRRFGVRYDVDHRDGSLFIVTNEGGAKAQKLAVASTRAPGEWRPLRDAAGGAEVLPPGGGGRSLEYASAFRGGLSGMKLRPSLSGTSRRSATTSSSAAARAASRSCGC